MFKKNNRYVTKGISEKVDIRLQLIMWSIIDSLDKERNIEVDYLQVFKLKREGNFIVIEHYQEVPQYRKAYSLELEDIDLGNNLKVYVIDSGEYSTMLISEEY